MASATTIPGPPAEHRGLTYWMERTLKELENVQAAPEPDAVHDLRVAIRRCRSVAAVMEEVDPDPTWPEMRKLARRLFRRLGELRDTQVLEGWVKKLGTEQDAIRDRLLRLLESRENEARDTALKATAKFDQKSWKKLERTLSRRSRLVPPDRLAAECLALERLEAAKELHAAALRTEKPRAWHELRIGVKRFRYTVESLLPARYEHWGDALKRLQDLLGDVHDLDVLSETIAEHAPDESEELRAAWNERITSERHQSIETYRQLTLGKTSLWQTWRLGLPQGRKLEAASMARIRASARALDANPQRTSQISQLSLKLFSGLARVQAASILDAKDARRILRAASRLYSVGRALSAESPRKAASKYLRDMTIPPSWAPEEWSLLANVIRYHRGALPDPNQKRFARMPEDHQKLVAALAGILRLARVLRKCGVASAKGLRVEKPVDAIVLYLPGMEESEHAAARLAAGKFLLESCLSSPLILRPAPGAPKVLELPKRDELTQANAASD